MDFETKVFLVNLVSFCFLAVMDDKLLCSAIWTSESKAAQVTLWLWSAFTVFSIPVWVIYLIVTW